MAVVTSSTPKQPILALNCGSSSLKFGIYEATESAADLVAEGEAQEVGRANGSFRLKGAGEYEGSGVKEQRPYPDHAAAFQHALESLRRFEFPTPQAVGHRFVHGGPGIREHVKLTPKIYEQLRKAIPYAPLHIPPALSVLDAALQNLPDIPQVICLDTAFHRNMPEVSRFFPLPYEMAQQGVQRYGFHGLSLESILVQLDPVPDRLVAAHLGNGASVTAIRNGKSVDTTMGLTPTGGIMMGTRCGDLDPGLIIYLLRDGYSTPEKLEHLIDKQSGMLGISGTSSDVRELLRARGESSQADLALRMFCYQARKAIAAMASVLDGIDLLVFTGGIGEHAESLRNEICAGLRFMGLDESRIQVRTSEEDAQICKITAGLANA
jgi:acetate kinase